jgi:hypothetical protein
MERSFWLLSARRRSRASFDQTSRKSTDSSFPSFAVFIVLQRLANISFEVYYSNRLRLVAIPVRFIGFSLNVTPSWRVIQALSALQRGKVGQVLSRSENTASVFLPVLTLPIASQRANPNQLRSKVIFKPVDVRGARA